MPRSVGRWYAQAMGRVEDGRVGTGRFSPWLDVCLRPQATLRAILDEDPHRHVNRPAVLTVSAVVGFIVIGVHDALLCSTRLVP